MPLKKYIHWNAEFCTECRLCELVCSQHHCNSGAPSLSAIRIEENTAFVCHQCESPACSDACQFGAISDAVDPDLCKACGVCISACPHHALFQPPSKLPPIKCDLCQGDPECVRMCPSSALDLRRKGLAASTIYHFQCRLRRYRNEISLFWITKLNNWLILMARKRVTRLRQGRRDTLLNRLVLSPLVKPFKSNFFSSEDNVSKG